MSQFLNNAKIIRYFLENPYNLYLEYMSTVSEITGVY